jgi:hypothetical protein
MVDDNATAAADPRVRERAAELVRMVASEPVRRSVVEHLPPGVAWMHSEYVADAAFPRPVVLVSYGNHHSLTGGLSARPGTTHVYEGDGLPGCPACRAGSCVQRVEDGGRGLTVYHDERRQLS